MSRKALVLLVCCCDFRDGAERLIPSKSLGNAVIRAFPGLFRILRMCAPRHAAAVVRPRERKKSADRRRRILISRLLIIRASVPRRKSPFPAYFKGFPAVSLLIPPYPTFLKYPVSPHSHFSENAKAPATPVFLVSNTQKVLIFQWVQGIVTTVYCFDVTPKWNSFEITRNRLTAKNRPWVRIPRPPPAKNPVISRLCAHMTGLFFLLICHCCT